ncbi:Alg9-like mannosyltransferase family-domain-containing protein [Entophlyctis helioformis]|nr:Alg9-like mannosyltransferase family-domain-containing protein [Entophlyctis helioformis]
MIGFESRRRHAATGIATGTAADGVGTNRGIDAGSIRRGRPLFAQTSSEYQFVLARDVMDTDSSDTNSSDSDNGRPRTRRRVLPRGRQQQHQQQQQQSASGQPLQRLSEALRSAPTTGLLAQLLRQQSLQGSSGSGGGASARELRRRGHQRSNTADSAGSHESSASDDASSQGECIQDPYRDPDSDDDDIRRPAGPAQPARTRSDDPDETTATLDARTFAKILFMMAAFRIYNAILVRTYFDPDEFWQSLEVAHEAVFGYGYLTWEWSYGIRGFAHPLLFSGVYWVLKVLGLDDTYLLILAPRAVQGVFAGLADTFTFMLALKMFGSRTARWTIAAMLMCWFNWYCLVRTYSNSLEACLTAIALYYWPWPRSRRDARPLRRDFRISLALAACACIIRPTNAIIWAFLGVSLLLRKGARRLPVILDVLSAMVIAIPASMVIDYQMYGKLTFVPWDFVRFNVVQNISLFYGGHPFHWYFSQGLAVVLLTFLPLSLWGAYKVQTRAKRHYFWMSIWTVAVLSVQAHKEFRFLMPIVPPMLMYAGHSLQCIERFDKQAGRVRWKGWLWRIVAVLLVTNAGAGLYLSRVHQSGVLRVMDWLRHEVRSGHVEDILFLMPCHSTPYYSHLHRDIPMRFVTCEPPIGVPDRKAYRDETDVLYDHPERFLRMYFDTQVGNKTLVWSTNATDPTPIKAEHHRQLWPKSHLLHSGSRHGRSNRPYLDVPGQPYQIQMYTWASHVLVFDNHRLTPLLSDVFQGSNYRECARFFNSHFHDDSKRNGDIVVYCRQTA